MAEETRVIVGFDGSPSSTAALKRGVQEARRRGAVLVPVLAWTPPGGQSLYLTRPCRPLVEEWAAEVTADLEAALNGAVDPRQVRIRPVVVRGDAGQVLVQVADRPDDLLVVGTGRRGLLGRMLHGTVTRYCLAHATCMVAAVPPAEEQSAAEAEASGRLTHAA